jgi:mRNA interferase RelE/StbE
VAAFFQTLAPEPRQRIKRALRGLAAGRGEIMALEKNLEGLYRLRVGRFRLIYRQAGREIRCFYVAPRDIVYEMLAARLEAFLEE